MDLCGYLEGPVNLNYISANKEKKKGSSFRRQAIVSHIHTRTLTRVKSGIAVFLYIKGYTLHIYISSFPGASKGGKHTHNRGGQHNDYFFFSVKKERRLGSSFFSDPAGRVWDFPRPLSPAACNHVQMLCIRYLRYQFWVSGDVGSRSGFNGSCLDPASQWEDEKILHGSENDRTLYRIR